MDRIFNIFDVDNDGSVTKPEFLKVIAYLSPYGPHEEKVNLSFKMWDLQGDSVISKDELHKLMVSSASSSSLLVSPEQMQQLIDATFALADVDQNGEITLTEYHKLVKAYPNMISNMTLDIESKLKEA